MGCQSQCARGGEGRRMAGADPVGRGDFVWAHYCVYDEVTGVIPVLRFFEFLATTPVYTTVRGSSYLFPSFEVIHLLGLTLLLGSMVVINLRLLGLGMR